MSGITWEPTLPLEQGVFFNISVVRDGRQLYWGDLDRNRLATLREMTRDDGRPIVLSYEDGTPRIVFWHGTEYTVDRTPFGEMTSRLLTEREKRLLDIGLRMSMIESELSALKIEKDTLEKSDGLGALFG